MRSCVRAINQREIHKRGGDLAELKDKVKMHASSNFIEWVEEVPTQPLITRLNIIGV